MPPFSYSSRCTGLHSKYMMYCTTCVYISNVRGNNKTLTTIVHCLRLLYHGACGVSRHGYTHEKKQHLLSKSNISREKILPRDEKSTRVPCIHLWSEAERW